MHRNFYDLDKVSTAIAFGTRGMHSADEVAGLVVVSAGEALAELT